MGLSGLSGRGGCPLAVAGRAGCSGSGRVLGVAGEAGKGAGRYGLWGSSSGTSERADQRALSDGQVGADWADGRALAIAAESNGRVLADWADRRGEQGRMSLIGTDGQPQGAAPLRRDIR